MKPMTTTHHIQINFSVTCKKPYLNKIINRVSTILHKAKIDTFSISHLEQFSIDKDVTVDNIIDEDVLDDGEETAEEVVEETEEKEEN